MRAFLVPVILQSGLATGTNRLAPFGDPVQLLTCRLDSALATMKDSGVDDEFCGHIFRQLAYMISAHVFNHLLGCRSLCNADTGLQMMLAVKPLTAWMADKKFRAATDELALLLETAQLLLTNKDHISDSEVLSALCPSLTLTQMRAIIALCPDVFVPSPYSSLLTVL